MRHLLSRLSVILMEAVITAVLVCPSPFFGQTAKRPDPFRAERTRDVVQPPAAQRPYDLARLSAVFLRLTQRHRDRFAVGQRPCPALSSCFGKGLGVSIQEEHLQVGRGREAAVPIVHPATQPTQHLSRRAADPHDQRRLQRQPSTNPRHPMADRGSGPFRAS